ncbi:MFS transporter [Ralstonia holmesii]|uniref:Tartrate transporter n=1 Tax=Ralstonia holmesii TaxID=3058602 RepID=A0ABC8QLK1_9RALS|nr:MFS transporter [Ralstonia sp. LMG 32967]CAJ0797010.1 Putative tartrate transporter [Ralstonia sp. LMG 32967]CAJ0806019.1 Putative tartrate transporter [Ralstonia sp. LMG 32967]
MHTANTVDEHAVTRKVTRRIVPFLFLLYIISYLDRVNIGYAALQMNQELALNSEAFGFASGIFFLGYFLFEVPSNLLLNKFGARVWIGRILVTWGVVAIASAFAQSATQLYVLRFLLGVAEAGFFPGLILYLTQWFRKKDLATTIALFLAAIPVSFIVGAPLSTWMMDHIHWFDWSGWRWMIVLEGAPALVGGVLCFLYLTDRPSDATWLKPQERDWLMNELEQEKRARPAAPHHSSLKMMANPKVLYLAFIYFVTQCASLGISYWMPQIIKSFPQTLSHTQIGLVAMVPYAFTMIVMVWWSRRSDRKKERRLHAAVPLAITALTLLGIGLTTNPYLSMTMISLSLAALYASKSPFWALSTESLSTTTAAVSIAVINSIGNLGGFFGPYLIGYIKSLTHTATSGLMAFSGLFVISFLMTLFIRTTAQQAPVLPEAIGERNW